MLENGCVVSGTTVAMHLVKDASQLFRISCEARMSSVRHLLEMLKEGGRGLEPAKDRLDT